MMLHLHPELVDMSAAEARVPDGIAGCEHIGFTGPVKFGWLADDLSDTGVIGDPTGADAPRLAFNNPLGLYIRPLYGTEPPSCKKTKSALPDAAAHPRHPAP